MDCKNEEAAAVKQEEQPEKPREKICISISEGYIRHHDEEPEIEEQFILRLPEDQASILHEALETDMLGERLQLHMQDNLREAELQLDDTRMRGKLMDLPTIIESHKLVDEATLYKTADVVQILVCSKEAESPSTSAAAADFLKVQKHMKGNNCKFPDGLTKPLKNVRKKRFRKVKLEENFNPNVDREVKRLLRADGAAESVRFELVYEDDEQAEAATNEDVDDNDSAATSTADDADSNGEGLVDFKQMFLFDTDSDSESGGIEHFDFDALSDEEKQLRARLSEINYSLSNLTCKPSPPASEANGGRLRIRGRGRGRPRLQKTGDLPKPKPKPIAIAGRGKRGRPPGRGRGALLRKALPEATTSVNTEMSTFVIDPTE